MSNPSLCQLCGAVACTQRDKRAWYTAMPLLPVCQGPCLDILGIARQCRPPRVFTSTPQYLNVVLPGQALHHTNCVTYPCRCSYTSTQGSVQQHTSLPAHTATVWVPVMISSASIRSEASCTSLLVAAAAIMLVSAASADATSCRSSCWLGCRSAGGG